MPICIECSYPVPQLYQRLSSKKKAPAATSNTSTHIRNTSSGQPHTSAPKDEGFRGGGEAKKSKSAAASADVRLMQCPRCKRFADKYVEHDFVVLFIDLVLVKPQVYRHLLFNNTRLIATDSNAFTAAVKRLGTLLVLFDVYLTWSAIEALPAEATERSTIPRLPILAQYLFYLVLCTITTACQHVVVRELAQLRWFRGTTANANANAVAPGTSSFSLPTSPVGAGASFNASPKKSRTQQQHTSSTSPSGIASPPQLPSRPPSAASVSYPGQSMLSSMSGGSHLALPLPPPRKKAVSTALLVSSCMKLFPILMVVWKYEDATGQLATGVSWAVAIQNVESLRILLGSGYVSAAILVALGWLASWVVSRAILIAVGLGGI